MQTPHSHSTQTVSILPKPARKQDWAGHKERGSLLLLRFMAWVALRGGRKYARALLLPITLYFVLVVASARAASFDYLARVLKRRAKWQEVFCHFHTFAAVILDRIYFLSGQFSELDVRIIDDDYAATDAANRGNGVFLMGAHMGSFEAVRAIARTQKNVSKELQLVLLMYEENAQKISQLLAALNPQAQQEIVALGKAGSMLTVKNRLEEGALIGILADRTLHHERQQEVNFLGMPTAFPEGPFKIAAILQRPIFLMMGLYRGGNRYDIHLEKIADFGTLASQGKPVSPAMITQAMSDYAARLDYFCHQAPYNWFNFYDFWHNPNQDN